MTLLASIAAKAGFSNGRAWDPSTGIPDLTGKVAIVTGGNDGIGFITARELHKKGCKVYLACRNEEKAHDAIKRINEASPGKPEGLVFLPFDLTELKSAEKAAKTVQEKEQRLDIIVCNAGIMAWPYELKNGVECQFWNHLGHFALVKPLLPLLIKTSKEPGAQVRVVSVSSMGHKFAPKPDFSSLDAVNQKFGSTWTRYGQSKLANILFATALQERLKDENIHVNSLHPGNIHTSLTRGPVASYGFFGKLMQSISSYAAMTPFEGAKTQLYLAASPEVSEKDYRGKYFVPIATPATPSAYAQDRELAEQLWKLSEEAVKKADQLATALGLTAFHAAAPHCRAPLVLSFFSHFFGDVPMTNSGALSVDIWHTRNEGQQLASTGLSVAEGASGCASSDLPYG
ncbi:hypothetical protein JCM10296v2_002536 [Rhodotorula toruloides]